MYDLALMKVLASGQAATVMSGEAVTFTITVYNQGDVDANSIIITDYIPTGLDLNDTDWTDNGSTAEYTFGSLVAGASGTVDITFTADGTLGTIRNWAEISSDDGDDIDSTPDAINFNQTQETDDLDDDNVIDEAGNAGGDEDDHDPAEITVTSTPIYDFALVKDLAVGQT
jgi:uncharacterized repeat protein (TIGR01451 family)